MAPTILERTIHGHLQAAVDHSMHAIVATAGPGSDPTVSGVFLRWFLLVAIPETKLPIVSFELENAVITGKLDLKGTTVQALLRFISCEFESDIELSDATILGLDLVGGCARRIIADRATIKGSLRLHLPYGAAPGQGPVIDKLRLNGAEIRGNLDLRGCTLRGIDEKAESLPLFADGLTVKGNALLSYGFKAMGEVRLNGSKFERNLDCSGASLLNPRGYSFSAAGAHIAGTLYLSETQDWVTYPVHCPFESEGIVRLEGARIDGDLDCTGGSFTAPAFFFEGWSRTTNDGEDVYAIKAEGLTLGADMLFARGGEPDQRKFSARGEVSLINARIGSDFFCKEAVFDFPGEEPLTADGITVSGSTFLSSIETNGVLRFVQASLKQGLYVEGARFDTTRVYKNWLDPASTSARRLGAPACGMFAPLCEIGGRFSWERIEKTIGAPRQTPLWLCLTGSKVGRLKDDEVNWTVLDRFDVTGCEYEAILDLTENHLRWRLREIDREYGRFNRHWIPGLAIAWARVRRWLEIAPPAPAAGRIVDPVDDQEATKRFRPQPYIELARTFRDAGYENAAANALVRLERSKTRYGDFGFFHRFWRWMLDVFLRYGHSPFRPVLFVLAWAVVSAGCFQLARDHGQLVATKDNQLTESKAEPQQDPKSDPKTRTPFNAIVYAVDTLIPIVDLNQKKNWTVKELSTASVAGPSASWVGAMERVCQTIPNSPTALLLIFNTFFGWLMTTLFVAGVSGLLRTGNGK